MSDWLEIRKTTVEAGAYEYDTFTLRGRIGAQRIRKQFQDRGEAEAEKRRLEVSAINAADAIKAVPTRLTAEQVRVAEAVFALTADPLAAVRWYLENFRAPVVEMPVKAASVAFLADRGPHVSRVAMRDYRRTLRDFSAAHGDKPAHLITTFDCEGFLGAREIGPKRFNNLRGDLNAFFNFCMSPARKWALENPIAPIPKFKIARGLPEIMTAERAAALMAFAEQYRGGARTNLRPGSLVPYFALCLFAGIRPDARDGEIRKLADHPDCSRLIDLSAGVIRIPPEVSKTGDLRSIKIRPNLAAWLQRYPLSAYPIAVPNLQDRVTEVRSKLALGADVLRHTYISGHVAKFRSLGDAALEAGNSEAMIRKHYLNMMSEADAAAFWSIVPSGGVESLASADVNSPAA